MMISDSGLLFWATLYMTPPNPRVFCSRLS